MNFNFVKLRRKLNYLKNLCQYIFTSFFIKFQRTHEKEIEIIHCNRIDNKENKELVFLGNIIVDDYLEKEKLLNEINRISNNPCFTFYFSQSKTIENDETNIEQNYKYNVALYRSVSYTHLDVYKRQELWEMLQWVCRRVLCHRP